VINSDINSDLRRMPTQWALSLAVSRIDSFAMRARLGRLLRPAAVAATGSALLSQPSLALSRQPFDDPELQDALPERLVRQKMLLEYMHGVRPRVLEAMARGGAAEVRELQEEISAKQEAVLFDALPAERHRYFLQYGCAAWTGEALALCASHSPLVEIGAGAGQWARALTSLGADIAAYDDGFEIPQAVRGLSTEYVKPGGVNALREESSQGRALLLVYPPPGPMASEALRVYCGKVLLYVGEGRGGYNADNTFFDALEARWRVKAVLKLAPFRGGFEKLYLLKRRSHPFK
jgi:hypothetical protein